MTKQIINGKVVAFELKGSVYCKACARGQSVVPIYQHDLLGASTIACDQCQVTVHDGSDDTLLDRREHVRYNVG